ncbi:hypothetical protein PAXRUDRAFT_153578 [Paxillus rubicundulus Ve08.2h10]|uniref:Uncharacterized protein n=1 Tax=Paxillus rubicundulus Ve08.2h10 TaxID=930991 RepID=A0A0D0CIV0_9AGAM|nr:hypothetical protein PAXRUDRAFT_153578 [Paxillus rubicundulus Ve08.2h10]
MEFKVILDTQIPENSHSAPTFAKLTVHFACLKEFKYEIPKGRVERDVVLAKVPQYMNVVPHLLNLNSNDITVQSIECIARMVWQQHTCDT